MMRIVFERAFFLACLTAFAFTPEARAQVLISTGLNSGVRIYYPGGNDWWLDPSANRFDLRVNGGASPIMKTDSSGGVTSSSHTLTGAGTNSPFDLTTSSGVHVLSGKLKLESGAWIEYSDGTVATSSSINGAQTFTSSATVGLQVYASTLSATAPLVGGWSLVGYSTFTAASKVYFYGFQSSTTYRVHYNFLQAGNGTPWVVINDLSSGQSFQGYCTDSVGSGYAMSGQNTIGFNLTDQTSGVAGNSSYAVSGEFTIEGSPGQVHLTGYGRTEYPINNAANMAGCFYSFTNLTAVPYPFNIKLQPQTSATGRMWVEQFTFMQSF